MTSRVIWYTWKVIWSILKFWPPLDPCVTPTGKGPNCPKFCQNIFWPITTTKLSITHFRQNGTWVLLPLQSSLFFETNMEATIIAVNLKFHIHTITFGRVTVVTFTGFTFPSNRIQWGKHLFLHAKTWRNIKTKQKKKFQREHTSIAQPWAFRTNLILPNCRAYTPKLHLKLHLRLHLRLQLWEPQILNYLLYWFESTMYQSQNIYNVSTQSCLQNQLLFWFSRHEFNSMTLMLLVSYSFQLSQRECFCIKELRSAEGSCDIIHGIFFCSLHDHNF